MERDQAGPVSVHDGRSLQQAGLQPDDSRAGQHHPPLPLPQGRKR